MAEPALLRLKVRHYEVDSYGHVNHADYVHYLETARIEALETVCPWQKCGDKGI